MVALLKIRGNFSRLRAKAAHFSGHLPASVNGTERKTVQESGQQSTMERAETAKEQVQTVKSPKCTFSGGVSINLKQFTDRGIALVECPDCSRTRSLSPVMGVLRFPSHDRRKIQTPVTGKRWSSSGKTDWNVVGGQ
jgi:hypothetical protein